MCRPAFVDEKRGVCLFAKGGPSPAQCASSVRGAAWEEYMYLPHTVCMYTGTIRAPGGSRVCVCLYKRVSRLRVHVRVINYHSSHEAITVMGRPSNPWELHTRVCACVLKIERERKYTTLNQYWNNSFFLFFLMLLNVLRACEWLLSSACGCNWDWRGEVAPRTIYCH